MRLTLFVFLTLGLFTNGHAQKAQHVPGQFLVSLHDHMFGKNLERSLSTLNGLNTGLRSVQHVSPYMNIWLLEFDYEVIDETKMLRALREHPNVNVAQFNHIVKHRAVPNDPLYSSQWQYSNDGSNGGVVGADIDAEAAWEITTGGVTAQGDDIVTAVLDDGHNLNHPDFEDNIWVNTQEIPGNGIDDDGNGYIDDYQGWSTVTNSDNIGGGGHGTPVAGIIGAKGNNGIGVSGVNWDVKVMIIKNNFNTNEAAVIAAYSYALTMRQMYNESNGAEGAFVVSTNASWGVDFGNPDNAPLWCGFYDIMGQHGILSCGATINGNYNVDIIGDLPTACPSDFMISVTNCNNTDNKVTGAGYGAETIDLGAHGAGAYTTTSAPGYGGFGGTSGATPHVTGAIALLYSAPCPSFIALAKADPQAAAILVRQYIFEGVDPNESLEGITTTGGRLNLKNSLDLLMADCAEGGCFPPYNLTATQGDVNYLLSWESFDEEATFNLQYRAVGDTEWQTINDLINNSFALSDLDLCTEYEFQVQAVCDEEESEFSNLFTWTTDGCCEAPDDLFALETGEESLIIVWNAVQVAESYDLRYRLIGTDQWIEFNGIINISVVLTGLSACSSYEVEIRTNCAGGVTTPYGSTFTFSTSGCGACITLPYCAAFSDNASEEWIAEVSLNTLQNISGSDDGYGDYTHLGTTLELGTTYEISVSPGYADDEWEEYILVWIDFNQNGIFEANEIVLDSDGLTQSAVNNSFQVPADALIGGTRMRVIMRYDEAAGPCQQGFDFGEVEDYCVMIADGTTSVTNLREDLITLFPNPANDIINIHLPQEFIGDVYSLHLVNAIGQIVQNVPVNQSQIQLDVSALPSGFYQLWLSQGDEIKVRKPVILSK